MRATVRRSVSTATLLRAALRRCTQTNPIERWKLDSAGCENQVARIRSSRNDSAWCEGRNERRSRLAAREDRRMVSPDDWSCRSEEHTSELQSRLHLVCRLLLEKKNPTHGSAGLGSVVTSEAEPNARTLPAV